LQQREKAPRALDPHPYGVAVGGQTTTMSAPQTGERGPVAGGRQVRVITSEIDWGLDDEGQVLPGIGEFGDRYFGTD
jgi:hypothetical protein